MTKMFHEICSLSLEDINNNGKAISLYILITFTCYCVKLESLALLRFLFDALIVTL